LYISFSSSSRLAKVLFFSLLLPCITLQGEQHTSIDRSIQDYVTSRSDSNYAQLLCSYLKPIYETQETISYQLCTDLDIITTKKKDLVSVLESELSLYTLSGNITLLLDLLHPTNNVALLEQKQQTIRFFTEHAHIIPSFEKILAKIHESEAALLTLLSEKKLSLSEKRKQYIKVKTLLDILYQLFCLIEKLNIKALYPTAKKLQLLFLQDHTFAELRYILHSATFSSPASFFYNPFTVLSTHKRCMRIIPSLFGTLFQIIGELDLSIAVTKLLLHQNKDYCLATYVSKKNPVFTIQKSWNPLLLTHKEKNDIVKNDFAFPTGTNSIIITGSNTSGKTVITCAFATAVLLAQTLTFAPATALVLTPFDTIYTILTARSEIGCGDSRFMSEVHKIKELLNHLEKTQKKNQYTFLVLDEIFTGTNPTSGIQAAQEFLQNYAKNRFDQHTLLFLSTHYLELTKIAQQAAYSNYKIDIIRKKDGTFQHTFTITPGISDFSIMTTLLQKDLYHAIS
jgi:DNA mismatch repair ATPase MutS